MKKVYKFTLLALLLFTVISSTRAQINCHYAPALQCEKPVWGKLHTTYGNLCEYYCHNHYGPYTGMEAVYKFVAPKDGEYIFDLDYHTYGWDDLDFFILNSCHPDDCIATSDGTHDDVVKVNLKANQTYYVVVDRQAGHIKDFILRVSCVGKDEYNICHTHAHHLKCNTEVWGKLETDHGNRWDKYCDGYYHASGPEKVFVFQPEVTGEYEFDLSFDYGYHAGNLDLFIIRGCSPDHCVGSSSHHNWTHYDKSKEDKVVAWLSAKETYYIVVDRVSGGTTDFKLKVRCKYIDCSKAPWLKEGQKISDKVCVSCGDRWNAYCHHDYHKISGGEKVYRFRPKEDGNYLFDLDPKGKGDLDLFILDDCNADKCLNYDSHTAHSADDIVTVELKKGRTYYVVVDQSSKNAGSSYDLHVEYKGYCEQVIVHDLPTLAFYLNLDGNYTFHFDMLDQLDITEDAYDVTWSLDGEYLGSGSTIEAHVPRGRTGKLCIEWRRRIGHDEYCYRYCETFYFPVHPSVCSSLEMLYNGNTQNFPLTATTQDEAIMWILHDDHGVVDIQRKGDTHFDAHSYTYNRSLDLSKNYGVTLFFYDHIGRLRLCSKTLCNNDYLDPAQVIRPVFIGTKSQIQEGIHTYRLSHAIDGDVRIMRWTWEDGGEYYTSDEESPIVRFTDNTKDHEISLYYRIEDCYYLKHLKLSSEDPFDLCVESAASCNPDQVRIISRPTSCDDSNRRVEIRLPANSNSSPSPNNGVLYWTDHKGEIIAQGNTTAVEVNVGIPRVSCHVLRFHSERGGSAYYSIDVHTVDLPFCAPQIACGDSLQGSLQSASNHWNRYSIGLGDGCTPGCNYNGRDAIYQFEYGGEDLMIHMRQLPQTDNLSLFLLDENFQSVSILSNGGRTSCKGWNIDDDGNRVSGSRSIGEVIEDPEGDLPAGIYYILVEGGCGNSSSPDLTSTFELQLSCSQASEEEEEEEEEEPDTVVSKTIFTLVEERSELSTLARLLTAVSLDQTLDQEGTFTLFAPSNNAFDRLMEELSLSSLEDIDSVEISEILLSHVIDEDIRSSNIADGLTLSSIFGENLTFGIDMETTITDQNGRTASITEDDQIAQNGTLHIIDLVLLPEIADTADSGDDVDTSQNNDQQLGELCQFFDNYEHESYISDVSNSWTQTGENDLEVFIGRFGSTFSAGNALRLVENGGARFTIDQYGINALEIDLWQLSKNDSDEGIEISLMDVNGSEVQVSLSTTAGQCDLDIAYNSIESSVPVDLLLNEMVTLTIRWDVHGLAIALNGQMVFSSRTILAADLAMIELRSGSEVEEENLISRFCPHQSNTSRASFDIQKTSLSAHVYPNPMHASGWMSISSPSHQSASINVYTASGRLLLQHQQILEKGINIIDLFNTASLYEYSGLLYIDVQTPSGSTSCRVIKME